MITILRINIDLIFNTVHKMIIIQRLLIVLKKSVLTIYIRFLLVGNFLHKDMQNVLQKMHVSSYDMVNLCNLFLHTE